MLNKITSLVFIFIYCYFDLHQSKWNVNLRVNESKIINVIQFAILNNDIIMFV